MIEEAKKRLRILLKSPEMEHIDCDQSEFEEFCIFLEKELLLAKEEGRQEVLKVIPEKEDCTCVPCLSQSRLIDQIHNNLK